LSGVLETGVCKVTNLSFILLERNPGLRNSDAKPGLTCWIEA